jgi:N-acetylmuramoyl-L-alanine amidase
MLSEKELVARTVWGEARGESKGGWAAVAHVIRNRVVAEIPRAPTGRPLTLRWWGGTFREVCLAPGQFDCWDPKNGGATYRALLELEAEDLTLTAIRDVVAGCLKGSVDDPTFGATHYYNPSIVHPAPKWARARKPTTVVGNHAFFAVGLGE